MKVDLKTTVLTTASCCPRCGYEMTAASSFEGESPQAGDPTVCVECGVVLTFTETMGLRLMTIDEIHTLPLSTRQMLEFIRSGLRSFKARDN